MHFTTIAQSDAHTTENRPSANERQRERERDRETASLGTHGERDMPEIGPRERKAAREMARVLRLRSACHRRLLPHRGR
jgi:hypothetical protein